MKLGLIDESRFFVSPVVLGDGTPYFPALDERINLELVETRTFALASSRFAISARKTAGKPSLGCVRDQIGREGVVPSPTERRS